MSPGYRLSAGSISGGPRVWALRLAMIFRNLHSERCRELLSCMLRSKEIMYLSYTGSKGCPADLIES